MVPFPPDAYMRALAEAIYAVAYLEWTVLGDVSRLRDPPPGLTVEGLSRLTMGPVAAAVRSAAAQTDDAGERAWLDAAAEALGAVVDKRNKVVHAHPATIKGEQSLYRWAIATATKSHEAQPITSQYLSELRDIAYEHVKRMNALRLPG